MQTVGLNGVNTVYQSARMEYFLIQKSPFSTRTFFCFSPYVAIVNKKNRLPTLYDTFDKLINVVIVVAAVV